MTDDNEWRGTMTEWRGKVIATLENLDKQARSNKDLHKEARDSIEFTRRDLAAKIDNLQAELSTFRMCVTKDLTALKIKAGIWGIAGGALPVTVAIAIFLARELFTKTG